MTSRWAGGGRGRRDREPAQQGSSEFARRIRFEQIDRFIAFELVSIVHAEETGGIEKHHGVASPYCRAKSASMVSLSRPVARPSGARYLRRFSFACNEDAASFSLSIGRTVTPGVQSVWGWRFGSVCRRGLPPSARCSVGWRCSDWFASWFGSTIRGVSGRSNTSDPLTRRKSKMLERPHALPTADQCSSLTSPSPRSSSRG